MFRPRRDLIGRSAAAAVLAFAALPVLTLAAEDSRGHAALFDDRPTGMTVLYRGIPSAIADYSAAMMRYRTAYAREKGKALAFALIRPDEPAGGAWTWVAEDGSVVRRLKDGAFLLVLTRQPGNWFVEVRCEPVSWPLFACSDGRVREMSAPDLHTMVLDGITYSRALPETE